MASRRAESHAPTIAGARSILASGDASTHLPCIFRVHYVSACRQRLTEAIERSSVDKEHASCEWLRQRGVRADRIQRWRRFGVPRLRRGRRARHRRTCSPSSGRARHTRKRSGRRRARWHDVRRSGARGRDRASWRIRATQRIRRTDATSARRELWSRLAPIAASAGIGVCRRRHQRRRSRRLSTRRARRGRVGRRCRRSPR